MAADLGLERRQVTRGERRDGVEGTPVEPEWPPRDLPVAEVRGEGEQAVAVGLRLVDSLPVDEREPPAELDGVEPRHRDGVAGHGAEVAIAAAGEAAARGGA